MSWWKVAMDTWEDGEKRFICRNGMRNEWKTATYIPHECFSACTEEKDTDKMTHLGKSGEIEIDFQYRYSGVMWLAGQEQTHLPKKHHLLPPNPRNLKHSFVYLISLFFLMFCMRFSDGREEKKNKILWALVSIHVARRLTCPAWRASWFLILDSPSTMGFRFRAWRCRFWWENRRAAWLVLQTTEDCFKWRLHWI